MYDCKPKIILHMYGGLNDQGQAVSVCGRYTNKEGLGKGASVGEDKKHLVNCGHCLHIMYGGDDHALHFKG